MFSRVPQTYLDWSERKLAAIAAPRKDKSLGDNCYTDLFGLFFLTKKRLGGKKMNWVKVFIAAFFEVFWVIGLKHADDLWTWIGTIISIIISFYLMIMAGKKLPVGTVYAVFVGMGTAGTVLSEIIFFHEPLKISKIILVLILLIGVVGLKLVTKDEQIEGGDTE